jgi:hypothetical protein
MKAPRSKSLKVIEAHKASVLKALEPLGFVDNESGEDPGTIFHGAANFSFDTNKHDLCKLIPMLANHWEERGRDRLRSELSDLLQLAPADHDHN